MTTGPTFRSDSRRRRLARIGIAAVVFAAGLASARAIAAAPEIADPRSDAPEQRFAAAAPVRDASSYADALREWRSVEDINAWIGARFQYDTKRALQLSETQRNPKGAGAISIYTPPVFFAAPSGVCVDLARFGVETLRAIAPETKPAYLMIEFEPVLMAGNTLRRHWVVTFERDGKHYFFADSKRPGYIAGPYASTQAFIDDYARYRGRTIVTFREAETYERKTRVLATRNSRPEQPPPEQ